MAEEAAIWVRVAITGTWSKLSEPVPFLSHSYGNRWDVQEWSW
jgi:hypothetical protein